MSIHYDRVALEDPDADQDEDDRQSENAEST